VVVAVVVDMSLIRVLKPQKILLCQSLVVGVVLHGRVVRVLAKMARILTRHIEQGTVVLLWILRA
jgi:hypothetical protein